MNGQTKGLYEVADGVWAWVAASGGWGYSNAGLIAGADGCALVDTLYDLQLTREMLDAMEPLMVGRPLADAVNTHGNGDHCFGNQLLPRTTRIHGAPEAAHTMELEAPADLAALLRQDLGPILGPFLHRCFGTFDFDAITLRSPDTMVRGATTLSVGGRMVDLIPVPPAHTTGDLAVHVPDAGVVFTGDLLFVDGTPVMWAGPLDNWVNALDDLAALGATVFVPGHGPVTDADGLSRARDYLTHVRDQLRSSFEAGRSWRQAAVQIDLGEFARLPEAERIVVTAYGEYRALGDDGTPASMIDLFTAMASWSSDRFTAV